MFELPKQFELKQDGDQFFIVNIATGWESNRFGLQDLLILRSGLTQHNQLVFTMTIVIK